MTRSHHRPKGTPEGRELADNYLDPDEWREHELRRQEYARCAVVWGEMLFLSAVIDNAMQTIFAPASFNDWYRAKKDHGVIDREEWESNRRQREVEWLEKSVGIMSAKWICDTLHELGWTKTVRGWPVDRDVLVFVAHRGLEMGLRLTGLTEGAQ